METFESRRPNELPGFKGWSVQYPEIANLLVVYDLRLLRLEMKLQDLSMRVAALELPRKNPDLDQATKSAK